MGDCEVSKRIGVLANDAVVLDGFNRAVRVKRKQFDQRRHAELRNVQIGPDKRLQLDGGRTDGDAVARPRLRASALPEIAQRRLRDAPRIVSELSDRFVVTAELAG